MLVRGSALPLWNPSFAKCVWEEAPLSLWRASFAKSLWEKAPSHCEAPPLQRSERKCRPIVKPLICKELVRGSTLPSAQLGCRFLGLAACQPRYELSFCLTIKLDVLLCDLFVQRILSILCNVSACELGGLLVKWPPLIRGSGRWSDSQPK